MTIKKINLFPPITITIDGGWHKKGYVYKTNYMSYEIEKTYQGYWWDMLRLMPFLDVPNKNEYGVKILNA